MRSHDEILRVDRSPATGEQRRAWDIRCPECGDSNVEENPAQVFPDRDEYDSPIHTRGGYVQINLICSGGGHHFALVVANHKGAERLEVIPLEEPPPDARWS